MANRWQTIIGVIVGVSLASAIIAWVAWRACEKAERLRKDPKLLRRQFVKLGTFYAIVAVFVIIEVVSGNEPVQILFGLPVSVLLVWGLFWMASKTKIPPAE